MNGPRDKNTVQGRAGDKADKRAAALRENLKRRKEATAAGRTHNNTEHETGQKDDSDDE